MSLSSQLTYISDSMAGCSCNEVRVEPSSARDSLQPSSTVSFTLPQNAILRLSSFTVHAFIETTGTAPTRIPDAMSLIERCEVSCGGQVISGASSYYGIATAIKRALTGLRGDVETAHGIVAGNRPYQAIHSGVTATNPDTASETLTGNESCQLTFSGWQYGFLAAKPDYFDTSQVGPLTVRLTMAPASVIAGPTGASYTMSQISSTMEVCTLSNPMYSSMQSSIMANKGYLPACYKEPYVIRANHSGITRASVSSRSLDRVMVAFRNKEFDTNVAPIRITKWPTGVQFESYYAACELFGPLKKDNSLLYQPNAEMWMSLGGTRFPQHRAEFGKEWVNISRNARYIEEFQNLPAPTCGEIQFKAKQVQCAKLNLGGTASPCIASGINSKQQSLLVEANTGAGFADVNSVICFILCETSALLMIGSNREVSLSR